MKITIQPKLKEKPSINVLGREIIENINVQYSFS